MCAGIIKNLTKWYNFKQSVNHYAASLYQLPPRPFLPVLPLPLPIPSSINVLLPIVNTSSTQAESFSLYQGTISLYFSLCQS